MWQYAAAGPPDLSWRSHSRSVNAPPVSSSEPVRLYHIACCDMMPTRSTSEPTTQSMDGGFGTALRSACLFRLDNEQSRASFRSASADNYSLEKYFKNNERDCLEIGKSGCNRRLRERIVGGLESLSEAGAGPAIADGAANLKQKISSSSRPAHRLRFIHPAVHQKVSRAFGDRTANPQSGTVPRGVIDQPIALAA